MSKLDDVLNEWSKDAIINEANISGELLNIPQLHCKYIRILNEHKLASLKSKFDYDKMKELRSAYYLGHLDKETLDEHGWEQFDLLIKKAGLDRYINSDEYLIKILQKKAYHDQIVYTCESILNEIKNRSWQIRTFVDYTRFINGS